MRTLIFILLFLPLLSGCPLSSTIRPDNIKEVPIKVPCNITPPDKPAMPLDSALETDDIFEFVKKATAEIELRTGYEFKLEAAIKECNDKPTNN